MDSKNINIADVCEAVGRLYLESSLREKELYQKYEEEASKRFGEQQQLMFQISSLQSDIETLKAALNAKSSS